MTLKELRDELRALRKDHVKPISKMRKGDISAEIEMLKRGRAETPAAAATPSASHNLLVAAAESVKEAKASEFPMAPSKSEGTKKGEPRKTARKAYEPKHPSQSKMMRDYRREHEHKPRAHKGKAAPLVDMGGAPMKEDHKPERAKSHKEYKKEFEHGPKPHRGRPAKGSEEAKERMRKVREARGKKD